MAAVNLFLKLFLILLLFSEDSTKSLQYDCMTFDKLNNDNSLIYNNSMTNLQSDGSA